ncbi:MAG: glycosyltransferase family 9 protein [Pseudomonadota bacterium]
MSGRLLARCMAAYAGLLRRFARARPTAERKVSRVAIFSALGPGLRAGDHIAASIVFEVVALRFPDAEVHLVTTAYQAERFGDLYLRHMPVDHLVVCDGLAPGRWRNRLALWRTLRARRFDACVQDSRDTLLTPLFAHLCGIPRRFGLQRGLAVDAFVNERDHALAGSWGAKTLLDMAEAYAQALAFDPPLPRERIAPRFRLAPLADPPVLSPRRPVVVLHPGGSRDWNRRWPAAHFEALCERLVRGSGAQIVVVGGEDEREDAEDLLDRVRARCPDATLRNACGGDLNRMAHHVAQADLVVGNDSAVMHIAGGLDIAAVIVFGPTPSSPWDAYRRQTSLSLGLPCWRHRPTLNRDVVVDCGHACPVRYDPVEGRHPHCMVALSVDTVAAACERRLAGREP